MGNCRRPPFEHQDGARGRSGRNNEGFSGSETGQEGLEVGEENAETLALVVGAEALVDDELGHVAHLAGAPRDEELQTPWSVLAPIADHLQSAPQVHEEVELHMPSFGEADPGLTVGLKPVSVSISLGHALQQVDGPLVEDELLVRQIAIPDREAASGVVECEGPCDDG